MTASLMFRSTIGGAATSRSQEDHRRRPVGQDLLRQGRLVTPRRHPGARQLVHLAGRPLAADR
jgi:hypothetical protein